MYGGFSCCSCEFSEKSLRETVGCGHALGMPLHAGNPVGIAGPLDCFDHAIGRMRHNAEIFSWRQDRLMMGAIDANFAGPGQLRKTRTGLEENGVMRFRAFVAGPGMLDFGFDFRRDVLHESAAEKHIQALRAVANGEDGFLLFQGMSQDRKIGGFAARIGAGAIWVDSGLI
jgi:hypothetical protein